VQHYPRSPISPSMEEGPLEAFILALDDQLVKQKVTDEELAIIYRVILRALKKARQGKWRKCFAWFPRRLLSGHWVWLRVIYASCHLGRDQYDTFTYRREPPHHGNNNPSPERR